MSRTTSLLNELPVMRLLAWDRYGQMLSNALSAYPMVPVSMLLPFINPHPFLHYSEADAYRKQFVAMHSIVGVCRFNHHQSTKIFRALMLRQMENSRTDAVDTIIDMLSPYTPHTYSAGAFTNLNLRILDDMLRTDGWSHVYDKVEGTPGSDTQWEIAAFVSNRSAGYREIGNAPALTRMHSSELSLDYNPKYHQYYREVREPLKAAAQAELERIVTLAYTVANNTYSLCRHEKLANG